MRSMFDMYGELEVVAGIISESWLRPHPRKPQISVFFHFEKKPLENLPPNWHNLDLTKIWQG